MHCVWRYLVIADVIDTWLLVIEGVTVFHQLHRDLLPIGLVQSPSSLSLLLVLILFLPIYFTVWLLLLPSLIVHMFHGDVKVGAQTIHPPSHLLGARWYALHTSRTICTSFNDFEHRHCSWNVMAKTQYPWDKLSNSIYLLILTFPLTYPIKYDC